MMSNPLKKTMVFLGLAEEDLDAQETGVIEGGAEAQPVARPVSAPPVARTSARAQVTPLRKVTPTRHVAADPMSEILTVRPAKYNEAPGIAESFREGVPVILNLTRMNDTEAQRLIDFASGLSLGLRGRFERVTSKVFLLTPEHIAISGDEQPRGESGSFFVSPSAS